ncbi:MAG: OsmC family protein [Candidatus Binatia bacterium]
MGGALEARYIDASGGKLTADVTGEIELDGSILVIRRIYVHYKLQGTEEHHATIDRVHEMHADRCPVARSLKGAIDIRTSLELIN